MSKAEKKSGEALTGPEKAAVFLLTVGEEFASQVFQRLDAEDIKQVGRQMARIDKVDKEDLTALVNEFKADTGDTDIFLSGNEMLEGALKRALSSDKA
ncbi:MAG: flagellar motor switch protein FliG, partial [Deltaproteobacteria bacterium]|nr:flagellar motor switch protein FliG [Deltaproteobacteria bacterium]